MLPKSAFASDAEYLAYLRDWFAGQALAGLACNLLPKREEAINNGEADANWEASLAYCLADAMLAERASTLQLEAVE